MTPPCDVRGYSMEDRTSGWQALTMSLHPNGVSDLSWLGSPIDARPLFGPELA
jgi:hypothetical protein